MSYAAMNLWSDLHGPFSVEIGNKVPYSDRLVCLLTNRRSTTPTCWAPSLVYHHRYRSADRNVPRKAGGVHTRGSRPSRLWRNVRRKRYWWRAFRRAPWVMQAFGALAVVLLLSLAINWIYQVIRKPSELFFPVSGTLYKTPTETWQQYSPIFRAHATTVMTPDLLAAIAQVEGSGNPVARTYWRWSWTTQPFEVYRPASSAVGMYQITDGTFAEARRYCIHNHTV